MNVHDAAKKLGMDTIAETAGELIELLQKIPPETKLQCFGVDLGGYDCSLQNYIYLEDLGDTVRFRHLEKDAWDAHNRVFNPNGILTDEEYKILGD